MWFFFYFNFERNYDNLKPKGPRFLSKTNINFHKNDEQSNMENPTHKFRAIKLVLQFV